ncbi:MAG: DNA polymerase III subunit tau [Spirochaetes bacterium ADurb.Bin110]|nr:MAG: DNA polymerase III subunit tau [Spirochaetes bacterium ADurb.Bin110]
MQFEVTATRKRPQTFEQLAGQSFVSATLISSLEQGRIAHAYLFSGPRGCGKTSTARILAKALNCEKGPTAHPCGTCDSCISITNGSSLDVIEIDGASNTSVDNIRQIKDEVLFPPNIGRYKIYIIDEVHMLSMSAFNALLKTIEEPPPYIAFIFATTEPHKVPATIKSRCQQFNFRLISVETIFGLLKQVALETGIEAEEEALLWMAREAAGSIRDAYTLFDQIASFSGTKITAQNIRETLGLVGIDSLNALFRAIAKGNSQDAFLILDEIIMQGVSPEQFLTDAVNYCRSVLLIMNGIQKENLIIAPHTVFEPIVIESLSKAQIEYAIALLLDAYRHLKESIEPRYEIELAIAKLCHLSSYISPLELFDMLHNIQQSFKTNEIRASSMNENGSPESIIKETINSKSSDKQIPLSELRKKIIGKLRNQNLFLASALEKSTEWQPKHNGIIIPVSNRVEMDIILRFESLIIETATQILGKPCAIEVRHLSVQERSENNEDINLRPPSQSSTKSNESQPQTSVPHNGETIQGEIDQKENANERTSQEQDSLLHENIGLSGEKWDSPDSFEHPLETQEIGFSNNDGKIKGGNGIRCSDAPEQNKLTESEAHVVDVVRKVFKGTVMATKVTYEPSILEKSSLPSNLSRNTSYSSELSEQSEEFADMQDEEI